MNVLQPVKFIKKKRGSHTLKRKKLEAFKG
jgi:hypothetical protein